MDFDYKKAREEMVNIGIGKGGTVRESEVFEAYNKLAQKYCETENELDDLKKVRFDFNKLKKELALSKEGNLLALKELKEFILWAKSEHVGAFKYGDMEVNFVPSAFIDQSYTEPTEDEEEPPHTDLNDVDDELLYHSSN